ncbi:ferredoxin [Agromyces sp. ISL-38]|uniref:ferredoxin n=1 Tax=Agromyces sp. ISL-38 TaxID=2819107 RepID=UPI001BE7D2B2|nr:ferredoxin [Agromyces sp. ISL-38]MBT2497588.1 ferredoxin [Agromyces sp. ISL-38]MBT2517316.1 ferredoxin [Streptomyces sp. ISL-90]
MKVTVNPVTCIASENCGRIAPKVFGNPPEQGGFVELLDANPPESEWAAVREAKELCPSATISIEADDTHTARR